MTFFCARASPAAVHEVPDGRIANAWFLTGAPRFL